MILILILFRSHIETSIPFHFFFFFLMVNCPRLLSLLLLMLMLTSVVLLFCGEIIKIKPIIIDIIRFFFCLLPVDNNSQFFLWLNNTVLLFQIRGDCVTKKKKKIRFVLYLNIVLVVVVDDWNYNNPFNQPTTTTTVLFPQKSMNFLTFDHRQQVFDWKCFLSNNNKTEKSPFSIHESTATNQWPISSTKTNFTVIKKKKI